MRNPWLVLTCLIFLLSACARNPDPATEPQVEIRRIYITATPIPTRTAAPSTTTTPTPVATHTPTTTQTATPTAPAIKILGNPRPVSFIDPQSQSGAPCGWVDTLDFPLNPPDGENAVGGGDFGQFRERYEKYHAGEDWGLSNRSNFGSPVYSIGHGQVTFAQPLGWGADKGVIILRHTFPDGQSLLSFYGHLDPPSVTLRAGACVERGDQIGQIGRPRTPPHLHFEIRSHMPNATGGGYWPSDPANAGWLPPSETISQYRLQVAPGALWADPWQAGVPVGSPDGDVFMMIREDQLVGIDLLSGEELWSHDLPAHIKDTLLAPSDGMLYTVDAVDGLLAYHLPDIADSDLFLERMEPAWEQKLVSSGHMVLMPLPGGGVVAGYRENMSAFSPQGDLLWDGEVDGYLNAWALAEDVLIFTTLDKETPLYSADQDGLTAWGQNLTGIPLVDSGQAGLYTVDGLYLLDLADFSAQKSYDLPEGRMRRSTAISLNGGGLLLQHSDPYDRRLLAFDPHGTLLWEFSIPLDGNLDLIELDGSVYLIRQPAYTGRGSYGTLEIFAVDPENKMLYRIFEGGSRAFNPRSTWVRAVDGQGILIQIAGAGELLLDPADMLARMGW